MSTFYYVSEICPDASVIPYPAPLPYLLSIKLGLQTIYHLYIPSSYNGISLSFLRPSLSSMFRLYWRSNHSKLQDKYGRSRNIMHGLDTRKANTNPVCILLQFSKHTSNHILKPPFLFLFFFDRPSLGPNRIFTRPSVSLLA